MAAHPFVAVAVVAGRRLAGVGSVSKSDAVRSGD